MSSGTRLLHSLITMGSAMVVLFGINFFLTPFVTAKLGAEAYGFITLANTVVSYAMMATTALGAFATRFIAVEYHQGRVDGASKYLSSLLFGNGLLCAVIFLAMLPVVANLDNVLQISSSLIEDVQYLFVLVFVNFIFTNGSSAFSVATYVKDRLDLYGILQSISYGVQALLLLLMYVVLPPRVLYYGVGIVGAGLVLLAGNILLYRRLCPEIRISLSLFSLKAVKTLLFSGMWSSLNQLGNILNNGLSLLIANIFLSALTMGQVAIAQVFLTVSRRFYQLISQVFQPMMLKYYSDEDNAGLVDSLCLSMKISAIFGCTILAGYLALGEAFNEMWIPGQDTHLIYTIALVVLASEVFVAPMVPLYYIYTLTVKIKVPCIVTIVGGLVSIALMFIMLSYGMGPYSVVLPSTLVNAITNGIINPLYMSKCLKLPAQTFFPALGRIVLACLLMCPLFCYVAAAASPASWFDLLVAVSILAILGLFVSGIVLFSKQERARLLTMVRARR